MANMTESGLRRWRPCRVVAIVAVAAALLLGTVVYYMLSSTSIPTCSTCTLDVGRTLAGTIRGTDMYTPGNYAFAGVVLNPGPSERMVNSPMPTPGTFSYPLGTLPINPTTADLCLFSKKLGNTYICNRITPVQVHHQ
jgi:hypothetical protein